MVIGFFILAITLSLVGISYMMHGEFHPSLMFGIIFDLVIMYAILKKHVKFKDKIKDSYHNDIKVNEN